MTNLTVLTTWGVSIYLATCFHQPSLMVGHICPTSKKWLHIHRSNIHLVFSPTLSFVVHGRSNPRLKLCGCLSIAQVHEVSGQKVWTWKFFSQMLWKEIILPSHPMALVRCLSQQPVILTHSWLFYFICFYSLWYFLLPLSW